MLKNKQDGGGLGMPWELGAADRKTAHRKTPGPEPAYLDTGLPLQQGLKARVGLGAEAP